MADTLRYTLCTTTLFDFSEDSCLDFLDYEVYSKIEKWCNENAPTAKMYREMKNDNIFTYITWYIEFTNKVDYTLFVLTR